MNIRLPKSSMLRLIILAVVVNFHSLLSAQHIKVENFSHPFLYLSAAYVSSNSINQVTTDPFYTTEEGCHGNFSYCDKTVRADLGLQFAKNSAFEVGYVRTPLSIGSDLIINGIDVGGGGASYSRISFYSIKLVQNTPLWRDRISITSGLGYAIGDFGELPSFSRSESDTYESFGNTITSSSSINGLRTGKSNFLIMNLGLEIMAIKKISLFSKITMYKGFYDLQEQVINYTINGTEGAFTTTTDGSFLGLEFGIKFNFR